MNKCEQHMKKNKMNLGLKEEKTQLLKLCGYPA